jgi:hypothetical protein
MHVKYQKDHSAFVLFGVKDSSVPISTAPNSTETTWVINFIKSQGVFTDVQPQFPSGRMECACKTANKVKAPKVISTAFQQIFRPVSVSAIEKIFIDPERVRQ